MAEYEKVDLKDMFNGLQEQMVAKLNLNRKHIQHPGSKGDALENAWIDWLRVYLPNRYSIDKAMIIDHEGNISDQMDIVIYDNWFTPFIFSQDGFHYIPAESVYAVFEVKPEITKDYIEYAGDKIESVRKLKRTSTTMINSGKVCPPRAFTKIIGGILTSDNSYVSGDNKTIITHLKALTGLKGIDIGCIAKYGSFYVDYEGKEDTTIFDVTQFEKRYLDYYNNRTVKEVVFSSQDNSLVSFFLQLTRYLQQAIGTVAAIDLNMYSQAIDFKIDQEL